MPAGRPSTPHFEHDSHGALVALGRALDALGYQFTTVTPSTHQRVLAKQPQPRKGPASVTPDGSTALTGLREVFGWNKAFAPHELPTQILELASRARVLTRTGQELRATVRFSTLGQRLYLHSGFPTSASSSVFFGPDSYRFCSLLDRALRPCEHLVDVGCGSGVGGLHASRKAVLVTLSDINPLALQYASVNAALASVPTTIVHSDVLGAVDDPIDAVIANPPYMVDRAGRTYRDGGGALGEGLALRIVQEALQRLTPGGQLVLYTGSPVVDGVDIFKRKVLPLCEKAASSCDYSEIDPDVFGEELAEPGYAPVERIAAVGLVVRKSK